MLINMGKAIVATFSLLGLSCTQQPTIEPWTLLFIGDSITSGHGLQDEANTYPILLGQKWNRKVIILAKSGMRATEATAWVDKEIQALQAGGKLDKLGGIFVALGGNDQLQRQSPEELEESLLNLGELLRTLKVPIFILVSQVPFHENVQGAYQRAAQAVGTQAGPDIIAAYIGSPSRKHWDGMHPSEEGHAAIADLIYGTYQAK